MFVVAPSFLGKRAAPSKENHTISATKRSLVAFAAVFAVVFALQLSATDAEAAAPLGRVVALGDSLASGQGLGPQAPGSIADCGRSTGGYPEVAMSRVAHGPWANATCNATTTDNFQYGWTGPSGATVPPQYDSLNGSEDLVIVGSGNNEAFFGKIAYDCTGYQPAVDAFFHNRDYPQQTPWPVPNHCSDTYIVNGVNQLPNYVAAGKPKVAAALTRIHQLSPNAKIILVGKPRLAKPSGSQCFNSEFWLTATDAPLYATWEDGARQAMIDTVNAFNASVPGNYARFVDIQAISGTSHTACEPNWSDRWINPHTYQNVPNSGIPLHHTPVGASVTANAIIDAIHAAGFDTGATVTNPVVSISSPASGTVTTNAAIPVSFSATDNIRIASCSITSGASVALSPGANTIVVTCLDDAGNSGSKSVTVMRDAAPPVISISSPANGSGTTAASTQLFYTATDDVGTPNCTPASGATFALSTGANTLSVSCTDSVGRAATASITVYRGTPPVVAINAPTNGTKTANAAVNVSYTVNGAATIPGGTSCKVNGVASSSATSNSAALALGANSIVVDCTNIFGSGSTAVSITRGNVPVVAITAPADGLNTTAGSANVSYTVDGSSPIPAGTSCTVNGSASTSTSSNSVALALGANTITVACTNAFGMGSAAVTATRGVVPAVAIAAPADGAKIAAGSVNVSYMVDGGSSIPVGTTCTVNGSASTSTGSNSASLALGANTITVACTNAFGMGSAAVTVTRGDPPAVVITAPTDGLKTTAASTNVSFTVNGAASIPGGTGCTVNGSASGSATNNSASLALGANTITVACTNAFGIGSAAVTVTRGVVPSVEITAPSNGLNTTATTVNVTYKVDGGPLIPGGTACTVNGSASNSTSSNIASLALGANTITVACTNAFGVGSAAVTVTRGVAPGVEISAPSNGLNTTAASVNVGFTVNGSSSIPSGTNCTVGGSSTPSATSNPVSLAIGANSIVVACSNNFGSDSDSVTISRGNTPVVVITAPVDGLKTTAASVNTSFTVDGATSIPSGTNCTVGGSSTSSASGNPVPLALGGNTITVACTNAFGIGSAAVTATRGVVPAVAIAAPADGLKTTAGSVNVSYTVDGSSSIPAGTSCTVNGAASSSTSSNNVSLALGANSITVACTSAFGGNNAAVTVTRGVAPVVAIAVPVNGTVTSAANVNVAFSLNGVASIPSGTTCSVNGAATTNTATNNVALELGSNAITVTCSSAFGSDADTVTVVRGTGPSVVISSPGNGLNTSASSINVAFKVDGAASIPNGTTCTVNGAPENNAATNTIALVLGSNTIEVTCSNVLGDDTQSVIVYRGDPPAVAITAPADGVKTTAASTNVSFTVNGAASIPAGTSCTVNGSASGTATNNSAALALGANTITVACTNAFGIGSAAVTVTRGVVPSVEISAPSNGLNTTAGSVNVSYTVDGGPTIPAGTTCTVNGSASNSTSSNSASLALGANTITVACTNAFGGTSVSTAVNRGNVPVVAIIAPANGSKTANAAVNVSYTVNGTAAIPGGTSCKVNGVASSSATNNSAALALGANSIVVDCTNIYGNGSSSVTITRGDPPAVAITAPADGVKTTAASTNVSFTVNGAASIPAGTSCTVNGSASGSATSNNVSLTLGANTITVACTNAFGTGSAAVTVSRGVAPVVTITAPSNGLNTTAATTNVAYTVDSSPSIPAGTNCTVNGSESGSATTNSVSLALGANTITVACTNAFGSNSSSIAVTRAIVDIVPPDEPTITRVSPTETPTNSDQQTLLIVRSEPGGVLNCKVNGFAYPSCPEGPMILSDLPDGVIEVSVTQTDAAGNLGSAATVTWVVDTTAPTAPAVTRSSPTASPTSSTSQTISYAGEPGGTFECKLDSGPYEPCATSPVTFTGLALGSHGFRVKQTDAAGNTSLAGTVAWSIEPPTPPDPPDPRIITQLSAKLSPVAPKSITPARSGSPFSLKPRGSVGSFRVTLSSAATVSLRLERIVLGASRPSTAWTKFKLKSGQTKIYLSGRAKNRALAPGIYKVHLTASGAKTDWLSKSFRIKR